MPRHSNKGFEAVNKTTQRVVLRTVTERRTKSKKAPKGVPPVKQVYLPIENHLRRGVH